MNIQKLARESRKNLNISQDDFAKLIGAHKSSVQRWETSNHIPGSFVISMMTAFCEIKSPPTRKEIRFILNTDGVPAALYKLLKCLYDEEGNSNEVSRS